MSDQTDIETLIIALIKTQAPFTSSPANALVLPYQDDSSLAEKPDRVFVRCNKPEVDLPSKKPTEAAKTLIATVDIVIRQTTAAASTMDTWAVAIDLALNSAPSSIVTLAGTLGFTGIDILYSKGAARGADRSTQSERSFSFDVRYCK